MERAEAARANLLQWFEGHTQKILQSCSKEDEDYIRNFRARCDIQIIELNLASVSSALKFADSVRKRCRRLPPPFLLNLHSLFILHIRVPYVTHLVCNAGVASFNCINWMTCLKQFLSHPMAAVTAPSFYLQHSGEISADNLGWVWQSNVFGHFILVCRA
jgi:3-keto steroid reductase